MLTTNTSSCLHYKFYMYFYQPEIHIRLTKKIDLDLTTNMNSPLSLIGKYSSHGN